MCLITKQALEVNVSLKESIKMMIDVIVYDRIDINEHNK